MKVLVIKLGHLGDTLLLTPTLRLLRGKFPGARIDVLVRSGCEAVLHGNPDVDAVLAMGRPEKEQRSWSAAVEESTRAFRRVAWGRRYDYAFDLSLAERGKFWVALSRARVRAANRLTLRRSKWRRLFTHLSEFDWSVQHQVLHDFRTVADCVAPEAQPGPLRFHPQVDEAELRKKLPWLAAGKAFAVIHPASRWMFKQWVPEQWAQVADGLKRRQGLEVIFSSGPAAREIELVAGILGGARETHFTTGGRLSLHELGWLLGRARLFLGVDTAAMHLAAAMQTPTVALFGPSSEWSWHPWQCRHELALGPCRCKPTRVFTCDKDRPYPCMAAITAEEVLGLAAKVASPAPRG